MCVKQKCSPLPVGCPENCPGIKMVHPYTGEIFPAFELNPKPRPRYSKLQKVADSHVFAQIRSSLRKSNDYSFIYMFL